MQDEGNRKRMCEMYAWKMKVTHTEQQQESSLKMKTTISV